MSDERLDLPRHPVIAALEGGDERAVHFAGYVGTGDEGVLRLYADLDRSAYVEMPRDAVLHIERSDAEEGYVDVYVAESSTVSQVRHHRSSAAEAGTTIPTRLAPDTELSGLGGLIPQRRGEPPATPVARCLTECDTAYANSLAVVRELRARALACYLEGSAPERCALLDGRAEALLASALNQLDECVGRCPGHWWMTRAEIVSRIVEKHGEYLTSPGARP